MIRRLKNAKIVLETFWRIDIYGKSTKMARSDIDSYCIIHGGLSEL
jgi:hypothetical protein